MTYQDGTYTFAVRSYASGDKRADIVIYDSAYYSVGGWEMWQGYTEISSTDGYWKRDTVAGFPAWESYSKDDSTYGKWVGINERFMVVVTVDDGEKADLDAFVNAINYQGIAALK